MAYQIEDDPFCCVCKEEYPVVKGNLWPEKALRPLRQAPEDVRAIYHDWLNHPSGAYICGSCLKAALQAMP